MMSEIPISSLNFVTKWCPLLQISKTVHNSVIQQQEKRLYSCGDF